MRSYIHFDIHRQSKKFSHGGIGELVRVVQKSEKSENFSQSELSKIPKKQTQHISSCDMSCVCQPAKLWFTFIFVLTIFWDWDRGQSLTNQLITESKWTIVQTNLQKLVQRYFINSEFKQIEATFCLYSLPVAEPLLEQNLHSLKVLLLLYLFLKVSVYIHISDYYCIGNVHCIWHQCAQLCIAQWKQLGSSVQGWPLNASPHYFPAQCSVLQLSDILMMKWTV